MKKQRSISELNKEISGYLLDSINLLEILENITDGEAREDVLIGLIKRKIKSAFFDIEKCRKIVCISD